MSWSSIKDKVSKIAPIAGTLLGGPSGAAVGALIAKVLDTPPTPDAVSEALDNSKNALLLEQWEPINRERLLELHNETLSLELKDIANARETHKDSPVPAVITYGLTGLIVLIVIALFFVAIPIQNQDVAYILIGQVITLWGAAVTYWVGTSRSSHDKTKLLNTK